MSQVERHKRLRALVKKLNRERKRQSNQIDILCNDLITAQREFMRRLNSVGFAAHFYKDLLGASDLRTLLGRAGGLIREELPGANVTFYLRHTEGCERHAVEGDKVLSLEALRLQDGFTEEVVDSVCKTNRPCSADDLLGLGLEASPADLAAVSLATVPLNDMGRPLGFILLYRTAPYLLDRDDIEKIGLIACGLARAIRGCSVPLPTAE
jgi:hypothetical protein